MHVHAYAELQGQAQAVLFCCTSLGILMIVAPCDARDVSENAVPQKVAKCSEVHSFRCCLEVVASLVDVWGSEGDMECMVACIHCAGLSDMTCNTEVLVCPCISAISL